MIGILDSRSGGSYIALLGVGGVYHVMICSLRFLLVDIRLVIHSAKVPKS